MVHKFKLILAAIAVLFSGSAAFAQCSGQFTSGQVCANSGAAQALPTAGSLTSLLDRLYGSSAGTIIYRGPTSWQSLSGNISGTQILSEDGSGVPAWLTVSGSGTVSSGLSGQLTYYGADGTTVSGNADTNITAGLLQLGQVNSVSGQLELFGDVSGSLRITPQSTAGSPVWTAGTSSGTPAVTASAPLSITTATGNISITGAAGEVLAGSGPAFTKTPTLGASGTAGTIAFGNATSGTVTLGTVTGALGSVTLSLPAATDTLVGKATTDTFTNKTYDTAGTGNSFSINGLAATANTGTGSVVRATSPTLVTPILGVAAATTINKLTLTAPATGSTLTIADGKTLTANNSLTLAGTDSTTMTFPSTNGTIAALNIADQTLSGGANVTFGNLGTKSSGTLTIDCGTAPLQYVINGGAFTLAAPASDGSCMVLDANNGSAGAITFSGFTVGSNTGAALDTTNSHAFTISIWRINGTAGYNIFAHQ